MDSKQITANGTLNESSSKGIEHEPLESRFREMVFCFQGGWLAEYEISYTFLKTQNLFWFKNKFFFTP